MADYLGQHPEIGMCPYKELHFFATDLESRAVMKRDQWRPTREEYMRAFEGLQGERRRGEASGWYLYSSAAPRAIHEFCPDAGIIAMLRNPLTMLPSLHSQLVYWGIEPVEDFEEAFALDEERERTGAPQGFVPDSYRSAVRYGRQLRRYLDVFGPERVHVIIFDRFRDDTAGVFKETCEFLDVDPSFVPAIEVVNPNKRVRSRAMRGLVQRPPEPVRRALHAVTSREARRRSGRLLRRWNTRYVPRAPASPEVTESLRLLVADEVSELKELVGIDVSFWLD